MKNGTMVLATASLLALWACSGGGGSGATAPPPVEPPPVVTSEMPLLQNGQFISFIRGFNAVQPAVTDAAMDARWNEAVSRGMAVGRIQLDWVQLEPAPQVYDMSPLENQLAAMEADGLQSFVLLSTIDSEEVALPADLVDPNDPTQLANGMRYDDQIVLDRFKALLDRVVPLIVSRNGYLLSIGNEPGNLLAERPQQEQAVVNFLAEARAYSHSIDPNLPITMTLAYYNIEIGLGFHTELLRNSDVASFNFYAADTDFFFDNTESTVIAEIDDMLSLAGSKQVVIQELGAAGGYESMASTMNATLAGQQQFFETVFAKMAAEPRLRAAYIFQLVDWDPALVDSFYTQPFIQAGLPQDFIDRFAESLETTGLIRYADGTTRPAWDTVIAAIEQFAGN